MSQLNGKYNSECLSRNDFEDFVKREWEPHSKGVENSMEKVAVSMDKLADSFNLFVKGSLSLLTMLILVNAASQIIQQLRDSNTSFKGNIGGVNGAIIELHQQEKK